MAPRTVRLEYPDRHTEKIGNGPRQPQRAGEPNDGLMLRPLAQESGPAWSLIGAAHEKTRVIHHPRRVNRLTTPDSRDHSEHPADQRARDLFQKRRCGPPDPVTSAVRWVLSPSSQEHNAWLARHGHLVSTYPRAGVCVPFGARRATLVCNLIALVFTLRIHGRVGKEAASLDTFDP